MCGRFTLTTADYTAVAKALDADFDPAIHGGYQPRYNVAPSDVHWITCLEPDAVRPALQLGTWGFPRAHGPLINARCETMHARAAFRDAVWTRRCGVVADGFLEWTGPRGARQPHWFRRPDRTPFVFAGLYRDDVDPNSGELKRSFTVLTTAPNALVEPYHDRMPVVLPPEQAKRWLRWSSTRRDAAAITELQQVLAPLDPQWLCSIPVSRRVSDVRHDDPDCLQTVELPPAPPEQQSLF